MHEKLGKIHAKSAENRHLVQKITGYIKAFITFIEYYKGKNYTLTNNIVEYFPLK